MSDSRIQGLYAVTPDIADTMCLSNMVKSAILGGAKVVQYRNKLADQALQLSQSNALLAICREYAVPLIINDDVQLAKTLDADGVHLGATDGDIAKARHLLGPNKIIGASCYANLALAEQAVQDGASYVAFGACFSSKTKPNAPIASLNLFSQAQRLGVPRVGIGGVTLENADQLINAGADAIAVIQALFNAAPETAARSFSQLFHST